MSDPVLQNSQARVELRKATPRDVMEWDVGNWSRALPLWEKELPRGAALKCLEVGGRRGGLSLWLALKGHEVVCSDLENPSEQALPLHRTHGVESRIEYAAIDATDIPFENHFDVIVFKSVLGGVGRDGHKEKQALAVRQLHKALKPGGKVLFAENLAASPLHRRLRSRFARWGNSWRYVTQEEMADFFSVFSSFRSEAKGFLGALGRSETQRNLLGAFDAMADWAVPASWRYILAGAAVK